MATKFRLALAQVLVRGGRPHENIFRASAAVAEAAEAGADVVLLPEAVDLGWTHPSAKRKARRVPRGDTYGHFAALSRILGVYICTGLVERAGDRIYNSAVLIDPSGHLLLLHRKINELDIARNLYSTGDRLHVAHTPRGTIGLMICADAFAPGQDISRTLALMGAKIILSPCSWAVPADHDQQKEPYGQLWLDNYQPVARDFRIWIAGASNVGPITAGPWKGRKCIGCSMVVDPSGNPVVRGPYGENAQTILYCDVVY